MKFRAVMVDAGPMREFTNIVSTISKLSKECVARIADDQLYFIVSDENSGPAPPILWCEIPQAMFFTEYQMPSSTSQQTRQVTHDIPVKVIPRKSWSDFQEPKIPKPDISLELPALKQLRTTIDRMRTMAAEVMIRASAEGRLTLQIKTDTSKVSTRFKDLRVEAFEGPIEHSDSETETQANEDMSHICYCRVDAKKLSMFLSADQISHNRTVCSIVHKKLVILCLQTEENVKLQCFITGIVF
ncbi:checkpoint protein HUS1 isoform X2 [Cydia amplana]|uniref:checkpoint protein HUS1 isoform X2 n=1 Tax=Cydia amplana TaxID=1869771 RepID=UPI002FE6AF5F